LFGPVIAKRLPGEFSVEPYVNLSVSEFLLIPDVLLSDWAVATGFPPVGVPSKEGVREPDAWMRVDVGLKGIKSIYKTALDGAASNRVATAIAVAPQILGLILMNFNF
jgi:hypothetical protein